jgi:hypothetical protein
MRLILLSSGNYGQSPVYRQMPQIVGLCLNTRFNIIYIMRTFL